MRLTSPCCCLHLPSPQLVLPTRPYGRVDVIARAPIDAHVAPNSTMIGIGMTPEGINQNYVVYEMMVEHGAHVHVAARMSHSVRRNECCTLSILA